MWCSQRGSSAPAASTKFFILGRHSMGYTSVDVSYAAPQAHGIVNVALHREYYSGIVFIFSQGRKDLYHV
jgi:hypothetical protein